MNIDITEEERHIILMAIAYIAVERPEWDWTLSHLAAKMDDDHLMVYREFKLLRYQNAQPPTVNPPDIPLQAPYSPGS